MERFPNLPPRMARLPIDSRGFPVPKFVQWIDGEPDFRIMNSVHYANCVKRKLCWICGEPLGQYQCFVIGPMCCINRISAEPPSHRDCARFAAEACPFLSRPMAKRNPKNLPEHKHAPGVMIPRNPGVTCLWITNGYKLKHVDNGVLVQIGAPLSLEFYREGRRATRREVDDSVASGLPILQAAADKDGPEARKDLLTQIADFAVIADKFLPKLVLS